uniref:Ribonuclease H-like domain-containing protein n=1 Tax=Tanacetum cinerariifolium TaxID=118510 RepID=A0A6L2LVX8_TANCI|nr:ribonuclease H-like domain-containing protein [Tanacetum cinerariifolium]
MGTLDGRLLKSYYYKDLHALHIGILLFSKLGCVLCQDAVAFCLRRLPAFCFKVTAFCFKTKLRFASRPSAFCSRTHCDLSQEGCVLSPRQETLVESTERTPQFGPERPRVYSDLNSEEKYQFNADIRATNILLQGLPKDIYTLINHYTDAKDIWDNVKMLLEGSELTKEDRESQLYDDFEHFRQHKEESIHDYYNLSPSNQQSTPNIFQCKEPSHSTNERVVVQNVQGRPNRGQGMNPQGGSAAGYGEVQNRVGNVNQGQARLGQPRAIKCYNCNGTGHIARNCTQPKRPQNSEYFKDKMLLMQAQENRVALDAEQLLFLAGGQDNAFDDDVDEQPIQDLALNMDNLILLPMKPDHHMIRIFCLSVQLDQVVNLHTDYTSVSNMIPYDQYVKDNKVSVVHNVASSVLNDAFMMIYNDMCEPSATSVSNSSRNAIVKNSLTAELATYREQVELYERRAKFKLTEREQKINEQLRLVISDRNFKEETLKRELHSTKLQLASTINRNKSMVEETTFLKQDFKQKENKFLADFLKINSLKEKVEDRLVKQDQSLQTVHMLCRPRPLYNEQNKVVIGYKNPLCLTRAKQAQPALYNGHEILKDNHAPAKVHNTEDTLQITEITRKKMNAKMTDPDSLKERTKVSRPIRAFTVYPPNTPATLVPIVLPTKSQVKIHIFTLIQIFSKFDKTCKKRITPTGLTDGERGFEQTNACYLQEVIPFFKTIKDNFEGIQKSLTKEVKEMKDVFEELESEVAQCAVDRKHDAIDQKNLLIANDNLIAECLSKKVFFVAKNSELNVARFTEMHVANTSVEAHCLALEAKLANLRDKNSIGSNPPTPDTDTPDFNSVFVIGKMQASLQGKDNAIRQLKKQLSQLQVTRNDTERTDKVRIIDPQITKLTDKVTTLQVQHDFFRAENAKIKQHYKELNDSIKITRAKHIEQVTKLTDENVTLKTSVSKAKVQPQVLTRAKHALDVKPIVPRLRNNWDAHLDYLRHIKESVEIVRDIVEEAKVVRPLDRSIVSACCYTKHSQELLKYAIGTCPQGSQKRAKQLANTPHIRKKQVTIAKPSDRQDSNKQVHVMAVKPQKTNVLMPPSTGVTSYPKASGSQPKSNPKNNRISLAKGANKLPVEDLPRTNKAFTASTTVPSIYIQQFWETIQYDKIAGNYRCQLDEQWFVLTKDTLREALQITPTNNNQAFIAPPSAEVLVDLVNQLATPGWKTSGFERPRAPVLQILWGIVTQSNIDYAERIWEEFTQSIHTFMEDKRNLSRHTTGKKRATLILIPSIRFTKLIIHHLQRRHKFHPRPGSALHLAIDEPVLGYLKFSAKGTKREVFGMPILEAEEVSAVEPRVADEDADYQKAVEESLKTTHAVHQGPLPSVVIREPESRKFQPLLEVSGKGKAKVTEEQAGPDPGNAGNEERSTLSHVVHAGSDRERMDLDGFEISPQPFTSPQPSTEQLDEGFLATAYPKIQESLKLAVEEQVLLEEPASSSGTLSSLPHLSRDINFGDQFFSDKPCDANKNAETEVKSMVNVLIQQATSSISISPMTSPIIDLSSRPVSPKVHQQFKATTTDTTTTTTTTVPPPHAQQQSTAEALMMKRIGELKHIMADLIRVNKNMEERLDKHEAGLYTLEQLNIPQQVSITISEVVTDAVDLAMQVPLRNRFRDLPKADMKEILHQCMWETESYKTHEDHSLLFEALEKSMNRDHSEELAQDLAEARKNKKKRRESPKMPHGSPPHQPPPLPPPSGPSGAPGSSGSSQVTPTPPSPPPPSTNQGSPSKGSAAPSPSKTAASTEYQAWTTPDVTLRPFVSLTPTDLDMDEDMGPDEQAQLLDDEDIGSAHIPTLNLRQDWWKPLEEERIATPEPAWSIPSSDAPVTQNNWALALASVYLPPPEDSLLTQTGDMATFIDWFCKRRVTIQSDFFFNKDLEYPIYGSKGNRPALSISKMKATYYPDVGLKQMVPDQLWINEECKYDIAAMYGISHWWFQRQRFYIDRYMSEGDCNTVRTHMRILSAVRIEVFSMYGYDYMKKIVLRRADLNEHIIAERDFKYLYPSDFEDLYLLNHQGHLNHLPPKDKRILSTTVNQWIRQLVIRQRVEDFQLGIESYQTQLNLTKPQWDATGFEYKHDYTVIDSPRAVIFRDKYGVQMMMRFNEIHKFSDGTLRQIDEALDYRVKEFRNNRINPGLNTRFWTRKDVNRCKAFMFAIQRRLRLRRIFRNLESFVGGRLREGDYRLLKLTHKFNPPNHSSSLNRLLFHFSWSFTRFYRLSHSELVDIEQAAVCSSLRSLKSKRTIESRAKRSSKLISLEHYSILLASSHTVKSKAYFKSPAHYPCVGFNSLVHSIRALSALRRSGLRTASTAAKPCQGDSSEFYLITGRISTVAAADQREVNSYPYAHASNSFSMNQETAERPTTSLPLVVLNPDDSSLEMDRNIGSRSTRRQVEMLLKDRFKGKKFDSKGKQEWTIEYIKRLKVCLKWLQDIVDGKDGLQTALKSQEEEFKVMILKLETDILSLSESLAKEESEKLLYSSTTSTLVAYSDADWAGYPTTRRSTSGYCVFLGNNLLSWSSKRQFTISRSSADAEYQGVANAVAETCWLRNLLHELHTPLSIATLVYCDNVSAVYLSSNPVQHQRTKHIEIDIHFVRDMVSTGRIRVLHVPSHYQYADIFTKGLPTALFDEFRSSLSGALDCLKKEKKANMALEKNQESLRKELGWAERTVVNANERVKMQEHMYASLQEYNTHLQDELREANRANKQVESEKVVILQELSTLRAQTPFLQLQDELRDANRANKQLESEKAAILQELISLRAHNTLLQLQDELREANCANKQLESEKAAILQELITLRAHNTFHAHLNISIMPMEVLIVTRLALLRMVVLNLQGADIAYLLLYVDDIVLTASSTAFLQRIITSLHAEFSMTDLGPLNYFLGVSVTRDTSRMFLSQQKYATEVLERAGMLTCNPCRTPVDTDSKLSPDGDHVSDPTLYRSLAGALQYLAFTRPDISYAVQQSGKADDGSLDMDMNIGSCRMSPGRQVLSSMNMQIGSSETDEGLKTYTKQEVEMLLKDMFNGKKFDDKGKQEWTIEYIKRLKVCLKWLQDVVDEKDGLQTALKSKEDELEVTFSKLETNILSLNESLAKEESEKLAALDCLKKEKEANMALEKESRISKERAWMGRRECKNNTHLQDELREANRANKQVESEKAAILQELSTLRAHTPFLQLQDELREANRANKQLESEKASILQELITLRAHNTFLQPQDELRVANRANKQLEILEQPIDNFKHPPCLTAYSYNADDSSASTSIKPDPFSLLQEDILLDIMSRIECTTKELIRTTSTISKRWQNLWASVPHLIFLEEEDGVDPDTNIHRYISFIDNTVNQCPTYPNLKLFKLGTNYNSLHNPEVKSRVNSWIRYAISRNVEEFHLRLWDWGEGEFTYDDELFFNSSCITSIKLSWCLLNPPNGAISWGRLESLRISCGTLNEDMLEKILSGSPCLETLTLEDCYGYSRINITSKSVKELVFSGYNSHHKIDRDEDYIDCVKINAPYILSLTIEDELVLRELALLNVSSLVEAHLDYSIDWRGISHKEIFRGLIESLNNFTDILVGDRFFGVSLSFES